MYFDGANSPPDFKLRNPDKCDKLGNGREEQTEGSKTNNINGNMLQGLQPKYSLNPSLLDSRSSSPSRGETTVATANSFAGHMGCPSLSAPDLQHFLMTSDSLDADIAALAHSSEDRSQPSTKMISTISSLNDLQNLQNIQNYSLINASVMAVASGEYQRGSYRGNDNMGSSLYGVDTPGPMDLQMGGSCLSGMGMDSIDIMNIGTFSHNIDLVTVGGRGYPGTTDLDVNSLTDSLDDFYTVQAGIGNDIDLLSLSFTSNSVSPRSSGPVSEVVAERSPATARAPRQEPNRKIKLERTESEKVAHESMFMDFFQPLPTAPDMVSVTPTDVTPPGSIVIVQSVVGQPDIQTALTQGGVSVKFEVPGLTVLKVSEDDSFPPPNNGFNRNKNVKNLNGTVKKKKSTSSGSSVSDNDSSKSNRDSSSSSIDMTATLNISNIGSIFSLENHSGLESLSCMSIDDGNYALGTTSEAGPALKVSSSDWNDNWERTCSSSSNISSTGGLLGLSCLQDDNPVVSALDGFGDHDEFMQFNFHSASLDILDGTFGSTVSHYPPIPPTGPGDLSALAEIGEITFEQLQLFQHQQLKGSIGAINTLGLGTGRGILTPPLPSILGIGRPTMPFPGGARTIKPGFKYANKQPVIKKDTATTSVLNGVEKQSQQQQQQPVISDTSDPKRIKLEKKKLPIVPPLVAPIIFSATVPPPVGVGVGAGAVGLVGSSSLAVLIPVVGLVPSSGGISDTVFHGFRRRSKLSEAELEDQRAMEQGGEGALLVARGRYKCGRCGQLKTNHVCEYYEDTSVCSTATQIAVQGAVIDPVTLRPWEGERFLLVGLKRSAAQSDLDSGSKDGTLGGAECLPCGDGTVSGDGTSSSSGSVSNENTTDGASGSILLNSGRRVGMGLKLGGIVHFSGEVDADEEWRMSVQNSTVNSARRSGESPFENIFQLRQALNPTFPENFDSTGTTPGPSTPFINSPYAPYVPIDTAAVISVLNTLDEKGEEEESDDEGKEKKDEKKVESETTETCDDSVPVWVKSEQVVIKADKERPPLSCSPPLHSTSPPLHSSLLHPLLHPNSTSGSSSSPSKGVGFRQRKAF